MRVLLIILLLLVLGGCSARDITFFSQTGTIRTESQVKRYPRQMTTNDLLPGRRDR